jgi:hypothetical protein
VSVDRSHVGALDGALEVADLQVKRGKSTVRRGPLGAVTTSSAW